MIKKLGEPSRADEMLDYAKVYSASEVEVLVAELESKVEKLTLANAECKAFIEGFIKDPLEGKVYPRDPYCPMTALQSRYLVEQLKGIKDALAFASQSSVSGSDKVTAFKHYQLKLQIKINSPD